MSEPDWNAKRLIVKMLATGESAGDVAEAVYERSLIEVDPDQVRALDPRRPGTDVPSDLERLFRDTRRAHLRSEKAEETFVPVLDEEALPEGGAACVEVDDRTIALFRRDRACYALADTCSHEGGPLSEGSVEDGEVECPWHGARFEIATGRATAAPAPEGVRSYEVRERDGRIEVAVPRTPDLGEGTVK